MSVGSYGYMSYEMEEGKFDKYVDYRDSLREDLNGLAAKLNDPAEIFTTDVLDEQGKPVRLTPYTIESRPFTPEERMLAAAGIGAVLAEIDRTDKLIAELEARLMSLAKIAHEVEWWRSGDTGYSDCAWEISQWLKRKAGIP